MSTVTNSLNKVFFRQSATPEHTIASQDAGVVYYGSIVDGGLLIDDSGDGSLLPGPFATLVPYMDGNRVAFVLRSRRPLILSVEGGFGASDEYAGLASIGEQNAEDVSVAQQLADEAKARADAAQEAFDEFVPSVNQGILDAQASASQAATDAANLQALVDSGLMRVEKASNPPTPGKGLSWLVVDELTGTKGVGLRVANSAGTAWMSYQILAEDVLVVGPDGIIRLKNGVVTAEALAAKLALVSKLVAGPEDGFHTELDQTGVHFHSLVDGVTGPVEMLQINTPGTSGDAGNVFALRDTLDLSSLSMSINEAGAGSFSDITSANTVATNHLVVAGRTLAEILWEYPRGVVAWGSLSAPAGRTIVASSNLDVGKIAFVAEPGRAYEVSVKAPTVNASAANAVTTQLLLDGSTGEEYGWHPVGKTQQNLTRFWVHTGTASKEVEFVYRISCNASGSCTINSVYNNFTLSVVDVGVAGPQSGSVATGTGTAPPPVLKKTYTRTYSSSWASSYYMSTDARHPAYSGKAVQGSYNGQASTNYYGLLGGFPSMVSDLSGATIKEVWVYVYFAHWYNTSGSVARIGYHNSAAGDAPTYGGDISYGGGFVTVATAKPGGAWVKLTGSQFTTWAAALKSGAARGLYVQASGADMAEYGYATSGKIEITYEK